MTNNNVNSTGLNENFIKEALYDKFKSEFANEVRDGLLNEKEIWIGDLGYLTVVLRNQGTKSGEVIKSCKFKFIPSKKFKKEINNKMLGK